VIGDIGTIVWKEWKELISRSTPSRAHMLKTIAIAAVILGIILWRAPFLASNPGTLVVPSLFLIQLLAAIMADSFAGERERHTLETLFASRLSDLAILIGKITAGVALIWGLVVAMMGLGIFAAYVRNGGLPAPLSIADVAVIFSGYLLLCLTVSSAAVLVSLRARTVRQAIQTLTWSFMILFFGVLFTISRLPQEWRTALLRVFGGDHVLRTEVAGLTILAGIALLLFGAARIRFQRSRLVLL
jgi:ABC-2 type transport system permease protein